jgi:hypothetical protein
MARNDPQVNLRLPAELKERIDAAAVGSNRSMNAEVVARLQASFETTSSGSEQLAEQMHSIIRNGMTELWQAKVAAGALGRHFIFLHMLYESKKPWSEEDRATVDEGMEKATLAVETAYKTFGEMMSFTKSLFDASVGSWEDSDVREMSAEMERFAEVVPWDGRDKELVLDKEIHQKLARLRSMKVVADPSKPALEPPADTFETSQATEGSEPVERAPTAKRRAAAGKKGKSGVGPKDDSHTAKKMGAS